MISAVLIAISVLLALGITSYPRIQLIRTKPREIDEIDWMRGFIDALRSGATPSEALSYSNLDLFSNLNINLVQSSQFTSMIVTQAQQKNSLLLKALAACWQVSQTHGAPLAPALQSALDAQLDRIAISDEIKSQLAGPKTAAITLALLPLATLLLAQSLGISAISWLFGSPLGIGVLFIGILLISSGTSIMFKLANRIEQELRL